MPTINRKEFQVFKTRITANQGTNSVRLEEYTKAINYSTEQDKQFGYGLGLNPTHFAVGKKTHTGDITLSDNGVAELNKLARNIGLSDLLDLGQVDDLVITIEYTRSDNSTIVSDTLQGVHFTSYTGQADSDSILRERSFNMMIQQIFYNE